MAGGNWISGFVGQVKSGLHVAKLIPTNPMKIKIRFKTSITELVTNFLLILQILAGKTKSLISKMQ
jgi:hypothetical protein